MRSLYVMCAATITGSAFVAAARERLAQEGVSLEELTQEEYGQQVIDRAPMAFTMREFTPTLPEQRKASRYNRYASKPYRNPYAK